MMVAMAGQGDAASVTDRVRGGPGRPPGERTERGAARGPAPAARDAGAEPGEETAPDRLLHVVGDPTIDEVRLPNRPESAGTARALARAALVVHWSLPAQLADEAVLLVSELVGNAVRHTGAHVVGLRMPRRRGWVRAEVRDPSRGLPCLLPVQPYDTSGRGLFLVDTLSDRWGVDLLPRGKTTWFEVRTAEGE